MIEKLSPDQIAELLAPPKIHGSATLLRVSPGFLGFDITIRVYRGIAGFLIKKFHPSCPLQDFIWPGDAIMEIDG